MTDGTSKDGSAPASNGPSAAISTPSASCARRSASRLFSRNSSFVDSDDADRDSAPRGSGRQLSDLDLVPRLRHRGPPRQVEHRHGQIAGERRLILGLRHQAVEADLAVERDVAEPGADAWQRHGTGLLDD